MVMRCSTLSSSTNAPDSYFFQLAPAIVVSRGKALVRTTPAAADGTSSMPCEYGTGGQAKT